MLHPIDPLTYAVVISSILSIGLVCRILRACSRPPSDFAAWEKANGCNCETRDTLKDPID